MLIALTLAIGTNIGLTHSDAPPIRTLHSMSAPELVDYFSKLYGVSAQSMTKTIQCESQFNATVQSFAINPKTGKRENSWGLVQINLDYNPSVTKVQATDKVFAVNFMARAFKAGNQQLWSCYKKDNHL